MQNVTAYFKQIVCDSHCKHLFFVGLVLSNCHGYSQYSISSADLCSKMLLILLRLAALNMKIAKQGICRFL